MKKIILLVLLLLVAGVVAQDPPVEETDEEQVFQTECETRASSDVCKGLSGTFADNVFTVTGGEPELSSFGNNQVVLKTNAKYNGMPLKLDGASSVTVQNGVVTNGKNTLDLNKVKAESVSAIGNNKFRITNKNSILVISNVQFSNTGGSEKITYNDKDVLFSYSGVKEVSVEYNNEELSIDGVKVSGDLVGSTISVDPSKSVIISSLKNLESSGRVITLGDLTYTVHSGEAVRFSRKENSYYVSSIKSGILHYKDFDIAISKDTTSDTSWPLPTTQSEEFVGPFRINLHDDYVAINRISVGSDDPNLNVKCEYGDTGIITLGMARLAFHDGKPNSISGQRSNFPYKDGHYNVYSEHELSFQDNKVEQIIFPSVSDTSMVNYVENGVPYNLITLSRSDLLAGDDNRRPLRIKVGDSPNIESDIFINYDETQTPQSKFSIQGPQIFFDYSVTYNINYGKCIHTQNDIGKVSELKNPISDSSVTREIPVANPTNQGDSTTTVETPKVVIVTEKNAPSVKILDDTAHNQDTTVPLILQPQAQQTSNALVGSDHIEAVVPQQTGDDTDDAFERGYVEVKKGDTLQKIADLYGRTVQDLMEMNPHIEGRCIELASDSTLSGKNLIFIGEEIKIAESFWGKQKQGVVGQDHKLKTITTKDLSGATDEAANKIHEATKQADEQVDDGVRFDARNLFSNKPFYQPTLFDPISGRQYLQNPLLSDLPPFASDVQPASNSDTTTLEGPAVLRSDLTEKADEYEHRDDLRFGEFERGQGAPTRWYHREGTEWKRTYSDIPVSGESWCDDACWQAVAKKVGTELGTTALTSVNNQQRTINIWQLDPSKQNEAKELIKTKMKDYWLQQYLIRNPSQSLV
ncbi:LysM peptidoglycan-binding domain-containing protein [Candidatus Woesearchaeota archaeon]|nr:LysM peptidoglycan-binding domain-containing protein [Candidatus Woesearchaeota archaeon]